MNRFLLTILLLLPLTAFAFGPQSSNKNLIWDFDFVEEFDGLQDWAPNANPNSGYVFEDGWPQYMPKLSDGSRSAWVFYSGSTSAETWIGDEADGKQVWRGTKSLTIDLQPGGTARGPTRFGIYFGDTQSPQVTDGYDDVRVFYMLYVPRNYFPTGCTTGSLSDTSCIGEFVDGQPYRQFGYNKLSDISINCRADSSATDPNASPARCATNNTYGQGYTVIGWHVNNPQYTPNGVMLKNTPQGQTEVRANQAGNFDSLLGDWMGIEYHIRTNDGGATATIDLYIYDRDGNMIHPLQNSTFNITAGAQGKLWDYFVMGGNRSYTFGPTMDSAYYVDDFIIDDGSKGQIGPRYFAAIAADNVPVSKPSAATNFSFTVRAKPAVVAGGTVRGNLTQCTDGSWRTLCTTVYDVRINCTNPTTRENGNSFLPAGIESSDWIFEPTGDGKTYSYKVSGCPFIADLPAGTYTVKNRTVLTHSGDGKTGNWSEISSSMEVSAP